MLPLARVPFWAPVFDPHLLVCIILASYTNTMNNKTRKPPPYSRNKLSIYINSKHEKQHKHKTPTGIKPNIIQKTIHIHHKKHKANPLIEGTQMSTFGLGAEERWPSVVEPLAEDLRQQLDRTQSRRPPNPAETGFRKPKEF